MVLGMKPSAYLYLLLTGLFTVGLGYWMISEPEFFRTQYSDVPDGVILAIGAILLIFGLLSWGAVIIGMARRSRQR